MTREEANNWLGSNVDEYEQVNAYFAHDIVNKIYDDFEQQLSDYKKRIDELEAPKSCSGCIHEPLQGENYYDPCGQCKQFYGDYYELKDKQ